MLSDPVDVTLGSQQRTLLLSKLLQQFQSEMMAKASLRSGSQAQPGAIRGLLPSPRVNHLVAAVNAPSAQLPGVLPPQPVSGNTPLAIPLFARSGGSPDALHPQLGVGPKNLVPMGGGSFYDPHDDLLRGGTQLPQYKPKDAQQSPNPSTLQLRPFSLGGK